jgi:hypothetical protein
MKRKVDKRISDLFFKANAMRKASSQEFIDLGKTKLQKNHDIVHRGARTIDDGMKRSLTSTQQL